MVDGTSIDRSRAGCAQREGNVCFHCGSLGIYWDLVGRPANLATQAWKIYFIPDTTSFSERGERRSRRSALRCSVPLVTLPTAFCAEAGNLGSGCRRSSMDATVCLDSLDYLWNHRRRLLADRDGDQLLHRFA